MYERMYRTMEVSYLRIFDGKLGNLLMILCLIGSDS